MSSPDIAGRILDNSKELDRLRKEQEEVLTEINKMHKKLQASQSLFPSPPLYLLLIFRFFRLFFYLRLIFLLKTI